MKKWIIILTIISFTILNTTFAQEQREFGLKGGINFAKFIGEDADNIWGELDQKYLVRFAIGGFFSIPMSPVDMRIEVLYSRNGAKYKGDNLGIESTLKSVINWLSIPVLANYNPHPKYRIFAGPYCDIFLNGKKYIKESYNSESTNEDAKIKREEIQLLLFGFVFGATYEFKYDSEIELRYSYGINSIDIEPDDWNDDWGKYIESNYKPSTIQLLFNYYPKR